MVAILDRLGIILFIVAALVVGPILLLALWTHAIALEMWHWLNKPSKESGQQLRGSIRFQSGPIERS